MSLNSDWTFIDLLGRSPGGEDPTSLVSQVLSLDEEEPLAALERESSESPSLVTYNEVLEPDYLGVITVSDTEDRPHSNDDDDEDEGEDSSWISKKRRVSKVPVSLTALPIRLQSEHESLAEEHDEPPSPPSVSDVSDIIEMADTFPSPPITPRTDLTSSLELDKDSILDSSIPDLEHMADVLASTAMTTANVVDASVVTDTESQRSKKTDSSLLGITQSQTVDGLPVQLLTSDSATKKTLNNNNDNDDQRERMNTISYSADFLSNLDKANENAIYDEIHANVTIKGASVVPSSSSDCHSLSGFHTVANRFDLKKNLCNNNNNDKSGSNLTCQAVWFSMVLCLLYSSVSALMGIFLDIGSHGPEGLVHTNPSIDRLAAAQAQAALSAADDENPMIPASKTVELLLNSSSLMKVDPIPKAAKAALLFQLKSDDSDEDESGEIMSDKDDSSDNNDNHPYKEDSDDQKNDNELEMARFNDEIKSLMNVIDRDYRAFEEQLTAEKEDYERQLRELNAAIMNAKGSVKRAKTAVESVEPPSQRDEKQSPKRDELDDSEEDSDEEDDEDDDDEQDDHADNNDDNLMNQLPLLDGLAYLAFIICVSMMSVGCVISVIFLVACLGLLTKQWNLRNLANLAVRNGLGMHAGLVVQPHLHHRQQQNDGVNHNSDDYDDHIHPDYYYDGASLLTNNTMFSDKLTLSRTLIHRSTAMNKKC